MESPVYARHSFLQYSVDDEIKMGPHIHVALLVRVHQVARVGCCHPHHCHHQDHPHPDMSSHPAFSEEVNETIVADLDVTLLICLLKGRRRSPNRCSSHKGRRHRRMSSPLRSPASVPLLRQVIRSPMSAMLVKQQGMRSPIRRPT